MCEGNSLDKKRKEKKKKRKKQKKKQKKQQRRMSKRNSPHKKEASMHGMCKQTPYGEKCQTTYFWIDVSVLVLLLSLSMSLAICLFLFCFVRLFLRLSFIQILDLVVLSYGITLRVPFTFERFCGGLFLGLSPLAPLYCRSPPFHVFWGFFLFWLLLFSVLFSVT